MDTESGRIYPPQEYADRKERRIADRHQAEFEAQEAAGKIVPVSDHVAELMVAAQAAATARKTHRKAQKAARKRNR